MAALLCKPPQPCDGASVPRIDTEEQAYAAGGGAPAEVVTILSAPLPDALRWAVVRGCFDRAGSISAPDDTGEPVCLLSGDRRLIDALGDACALPVTRSPEALAWTGSNALDLLARLYDGATRFLPAHRDRYLAWRMRVPGLSGPPAGVFRWARLLPEAQPPTKRRASDSGYDLTLVAAGEGQGPMRFYRTGIQIQPAFGWYFDLVPRSSISRTGHILANSVGVIDRGYTGEILVPMIKVDPAAPDLPLPARIVQIIPRPIVHVDLVEVPALDDTGRGSGGFGSTGH